MLLTAILTMAMHSPHALGMAALALGVAVVGACGTLSAQFSQMNACPDNNVERDWVPVDYITPERGAKPGQQVITKWGGVSARDPLGRFAHIRAMKIAGNAVFTSDGANEAVSAYQLRSIIYDIFLSDAGKRPYMSALDGRTVIDDAWFRHYRLPFGPLTGAISPNIAAGEFEVPIDLEFVLQSRRRGTDGNEGLILLAAIQAVTGSAGFTFRLRNAILGNPAAPAGLTLDSFKQDDGSAGLVLWADVVYRDQPVSNSPWSVNEYTLSERTGTMHDAGDVTEYCEGRYFPEDAAGNLGQALVEPIDTITMTVGKTNVGPTRAIDYRRRMSSLALSAQDSAAQLGLANLGLPAESGVSLSHLTLIPQRDRAHAASGVITYKFGTQPAQFTRVVTRTWSCDNAKRSELIAAAVYGTGTPCAVVQANGDQISDPTGPKAIVNLNDVSKAP